MNDTRAQILERNFQAVRLHGFQGMRADKVITDLGITKGALYHYFPNKFELGYAIVDELIAPVYVNSWRPFEEATANHQPLYPLWPSYIPYLSLVLKFQFLDLFIMPPKASPRKRGHKRKRSTPQQAYTGLGFSIAVMEEEERRRVHMGRWGIGACFIVLAAIVR